MSTFIEFVSCYNNVSSHLNSNRCIDDGIRDKLQEIFEDKQKYQSNYYILYHSYSKLFIFADILSKVLLNEDHFYVFDDSVKDLSASQIFDKYCGIEGDHNKNFAMIAKSCTYDLFDNALIHAGESPLHFLFSKSHVIFKDENMLEIINKYINKFEKSQQKKIKEIYSRFCDEVEKYANTLVIYYIPNNTAQKYIYASAAYGTNINKFKESVPLQARIVNLDHSNDSLKKNNITVKKYHNLPTEIIQMYEDEIRNICEIC